MPNHSASIQLCVQKLRILIEDSDQNLKYLGLLAMSKILKTHPKSVQAHKDLIMQCLDDKDESIRLRALDLLYGMVSKKNLMEIVKKLMVHMDKAEGTTYRDELLSKIIQICSQNNYQYITNFEWYVSVLVELTRMEGSQHGSLVACQMLDVATRVQAIREFAVQQMALLIDNAHLLTVQSSTMSHVLYAAAWISGEFSQYLTDPQSTLEAMLRGRVFALPGHIQAVYVQNILKLFTHILTRTEEQQDVERMNKLCDMIAENLPQFVSSADLEVQERASSALQLLRYLQKQLNKGEFGLAAEMAALFVGELNPVAPKAQKKVQVPEGLDLDVWINDPPSESSEDEDVSDVGAHDIFVKIDRLADGMSSTNNHNKQSELTEEELEKRRQARKMEQANNPHYLKTSNDHKTKNKFNSTVIDEFDGVYEELDLAVPLKIPGLASSDNYLSLDQSTKKGRKNKKKKKGRKGEVTRCEEEEEDIAPLHIVNTDIGEMPEGAQVSDGEDLDSRPNDDPHKALDINLDEPLRDEEKLPVLTHRTVESPPIPLEQPAEKVKKRHRHKDKSRSKDIERKLKSKSKDYQSSKNTKKAADGVNLWLSEDSPEYQTVISETNQKDTHVVKNVELKNSREKKKKTKEGKKDKKKGQAKFKEGYEEAAGISTPSKEVVEDSVPGSVTSEVNQLIALAHQPPLSAYITLAGDKNLQLMYETRLLPHENDQITVSILLKNQSSSVIKELVFSMCDTPAVSLLRAVCNGFDIITCTIV